MTECPRVSIRLLGSRFVKGCQLINQEAGDGEQLENLDAVLDVMDLDNNNSIDINEFFEVRESLINPPCVGRR